ncbi:hypothetical protein [Natronosalvus caseinilyticus]|uniref:hypothetical protein n=1 Tax=Natronosalvus caseinilyticus TaxID=2953747 RepID=UPI0028B02C64|nr:hypothetical protein [Natronosalvus caseinilyticus]
MSGVRRLREDEVMIERGGVYTHDKYGKVTITGIWKGVSSINRTRDLTEDDTVVVNYVVEGPTPVDLADTLDEFLEAIDVTP